VVNLRTGKVHPRIAGEENIGTSPFAPPSPREQRAKDAAYAAWLKQHAPRRHSRVGWSSPPVYDITVGCPCSDQGTLF
jgi:hypothetical protein